MKKMKKLMILLVSLTMASTMLAGVAAACKSNGTESSGNSTNSESSGIVDPTTITLSETSKTLDRYESFTLTADQAEVTWSSDNESVATVAGGLVQAKGVGTANITAKLGDVTAVCVVTVEDSGAMPVLNVSDSELELIVKETYGLTGSVVYKKAEQSDAVISYSSSDPTIASIDENGNITALKYGTVTITVTAAWHGVESEYLTETVTLTVKEDVAVTIEQSTATVYTSAVTIEGQEFKNTVTLTGSVLVNGLAEGIDASKISWESSDENVATVENGVVTAVGEGTANITVSYETEAQKYVSTPTVVTVSYPTLDKTDSILVDLDATVATIGEQLSAKAIFGDSAKTIVKVIAGSDYATDLSADATWLKEHNTGDEKERTNTLTVYNAEYAYTVKALVVTKVISTYEELTKLQEYGNVEKVAASDVTYYNYSGYFVLGNDIVVADGAAAINTKSAGIIASGGWIVDANGFSGTFDGRGHSIVNAKFGAGGLLGDISKNGVVKNLAVIDATITEEDDANAGAGILSYSFLGKAENIFVSYTTLKARNGVFGRITKGGSITDMVIYYKKSGGYYGGAVAGWNVASTKVDNVYVIYADGMAAADCLVTGTNDLQYNGKVTEIKEGELSSAAFSGLDESTWLVQKGVMPIFKSAIDKFEIDNSELTVEMGSEVTLTAGLKNIAGNAMSYYPVTWTSSNESVATVENGKLTLVAVGETTITASCGEYAATCKVTVEKAAIPVEDKTSVQLYLDANSAESLTAQILNGAKNAKLFDSFDAVKVVDASDATGADLTADATWLKTIDNGDERDKTLVIYGEALGYKISVKVVTKIITSYEELTKLQEYAGVEEVVTTSGNYSSTYNNYSGYFVLGNDIVVNDSAAAINTKSIGALSSQGTLKGENGFSGTFDGRGYSIVNAKFGAGGLLGDISKNGVVKNLAIVDATITEEESANAGAGILGYSFWGTAENIFVSYTTLKARTGVLGRYTNGGSVSDMVVYYKKGGGYNNGALMSWSVGTMKVDNVYVVYSSANTKANCLLNGEQTFASASSVTAIKEGELSSATFSGLDESTWLVQKGAMPIFKSAIDKFEIDNSELTVQIGSEVTLTAGLKNIAGNVMSYCPVTWTSSNESVATVENGKLTLVAVGETTITASFGEYAATCKITVEKAAVPVEDKTSVQLYLDANSEDSLAAQILNGAKGASLFDSFDVVKVVDASDMETDISSNAAYLDTIDADGTARDKTLFVYGEAVAYKVSVKIVTKVITKATELAALQSYTSVSTGTNVKGATYYSYGGYFVLANNLTAAADDAVLAAPSLGDIASGGDATKEYGFHGTFDGQGYTVDGFTYGVGGVFGDIGDNAVIKNVAFINCDLVTKAANGIGVLSVNARGSWSVSNVYVQGEAKANNHGLLMGRSTSGGTISDTIIVLKSTSTWKTGSVSGWRVGATTYSNVTVIYESDSLEKSSKLYGDQAELVSGVKEYREQADGTLKQITARTGDTGVTELTVSETAATSADFSYTGSYWTTADGSIVPTFKSSISE